MHLLSSSANWCSTRDLRPPVGEQIAVSYRTVGRAVGRAVNTASQQALAQLVCLQYPLGSVLLHSPTRAQFAGLSQCGTAMEQAAASVSALWSGTYKGRAPP